MSKITKKQLEEFILITDGGFGEIYDSTDGKGHYNRQKSSAWAGDVKEYLSKNEKFNFVSYDVDDLLEILKIHEEIETIRDLETHLHDHTECSFEDIAEWELEEEPKDFEEIIKHRKLKQLRTDFIREYKKAYTDIMHGLNLKRTLIEFCPFDEWEEKDFTDGIKNIESIARDDILNSL